MRSMESNDLEIFRVGHEDVKRIRKLMDDVISRLPAQELFAMDDEAYFHEHIEEKGEIYGAFLDGELVAYSVLAFPGISEKNLGRETAHPDNVPSIINLEAAGFIRQFTRPMYGGKIRHCYSKRIVP